jgi:hypothetical protein
VDCTLTVVHSKLANQDAHLHMRPRRRVCGWLLRNCKVIVDFGERGQERGRACRPLVELNVQFMQNKTYVQPHAGRVGVSARLKAVCSG